MKRSKKKRIIAWRNKNKFQIQEAQLIRMADAVVQTDPQIEALVLESKKAKKEKKPKEKLATETKQEVVVEKTETVVTPQADEKENV